MDIDKETRGRQYKTFKQIEKYADKIQDYMVKCKCSHTMLFTRSKDRIICSHCGNYVYRDKGTEFKYKMKERLR